MDPRETAERNQEGLTEQAVKPYRELLLRWLRAYGNVDRLDRDHTEVEMFKCFLATASLLGIEPAPPDRPWEKKS